MIDIASLLGPLCADDYRRYSALGPKDRDYALLKITDKFGNPKDELARETRAKMWEQYNELIKQVNNSNSGNVLEFVQKFILLNSETARSEFLEPRTRLAAHLQEIEKFSTSFFLTAEGHSRFGISILSERHAKLISYLIAPLHDLAKYLGSPLAQVVPDHEIMAAELVRRTFEGKNVSLAGTESVLTVEDINFTAGVIGDHENLEKELGRREWIKSTNPIERAKALFSIADTLTAALVSQDQGKTWLVDPSQFRKRFTDLYFRHIDLEKGKIFRPEWGLHTIEDLAFSLEYLESHSSVKIHGLTPQETIKEAMKQSGLEAIDSALAANKDRLLQNSSGTSMLTFSPQQLEAILRVRSELSDI
jgi:hypothetical protein